MQGFSNFILQIFNSPSSPFSFSHYLPRSHAFSPNPEATVLLLPFFYSSRAAQQACGGGRQETENFSVWAPSCQPVPAPALGSAPPIRAPVPRQMPRKPAVQDGLSDSKRNCVMPIHREHKEECFWAKPPPTPSAPHPPRGPSSPRSPALGEERAREGKREGRSRGLFTHAHGWSPELRCAHKGGTRLPPLGSKNTAARRNRCPFSKPSRESPMSGPAGRLRWWGTWYHRPGLGVLVNQKVRKHLSSATSKPTSPAALRSENNLETQPYGAGSSTQRLHASSRSRTTLDLSHWRTAVPTRTHHPVSFYGRVAPKTWSLTATWQGDLCLWP